MRVRGRKRPTVAAGIVTSKAGRLVERVASSLRPHVDEIIVGVDERAADDTFGSACAVADVVFRFQHTGSSMPVKGSLGTFTRCDWLLEVDDDELFDEHLPAVLPTLLDGEHTHAYFPRKWIATIDPLRYAARQPWFPDWQLRLIRNDASLYWHPPEAHIGFTVVGTPRYESRTSILHFESQEADPDERRAKIDRYRNARVPSLEHYAKIPPASAAPLDVPPLLPSEGGSDRVRTHVIDGVVGALPANALPPWGAHLEVEMPEAVAARSTTFVRLRAHNTGVLRWVPPCGLRWPILQFGYVVTSEGTTGASAEGARSPMPYQVEPGESADVLATFVAPPEPGRVRVAWDVVSEHEAWFHECGSSAAIFDVDIIAAR